MNDTTITKIDTYAARLLMVSFFVADRVGMFIAVGASIYFFLRTMLLKQWPKGKDMMWALLLGSGFLLYLLALPITAPEYRKELLHICERRESMLLFPLLFAIITPAFRRLIRGELVCFVYACLVSCALSNADFAYHYYMGHDGTHPLSHVLYRMYFEAVSGLHPTYMGMYLVFSICILLDTDRFNGKRARIVKYGMLYLLVLFLLSLLAKSPLLAMMLIVLHAVYVNRQALYRYKAWLLGGAAATVATAFAVPFFRQRVAEMFTVRNTETANTVSNSLYLRKLIWHIDTDLIGQHWLTGVGPGRMLRTVHERYFFYSLHQQFPIGYYDPHSEYFAEWLSFGVLGIALLAVVLIVHFMKSLRMKDNLYLYLMLILCITFFTETVLGRQQGVVFYGVFTSLFFFCRPVTKNV